MRTRIAMVVAAMLAALLLVLAHQRPAAGDPDAVPSETRAAVAIQTANPYSFAVRLEVKCDWEWQKGRYRFHQFIVVPGKRQTLIRVPSNLKFCEIWPKVIW